jgi:dihydropteroate synthase
VRALAFSGKMQAASGRELPDFGGFERWPLHPHSGEYGYALRQLRMTVDVSPSKLAWRIRGREIVLGGRPKLMGIVNVTPDSFSDGGRFLDPKAAVDHALSLIAEGADILDIGGESTRPGAQPASLADELRRVVPVVERLALQSTVPISVDTYKSEVAREALQAGASIINDISGLQFDPAMVTVCREFAAGVVCMHIQGTPQTMQLAPHYDDVVREVSEFCGQRLKALVGCGLSAEQIVWDPGIGFGKTAEHNLEILSHVAEFRLLGRPVLIGHSRKGFLKRVLGRTVDERLFGTLGVTVALAAQGVDILRVHDVAATRDVLTAWETVLHWPDRKQLAEAPGLI